MHCAFLSACIAMNYRHAYHAGNFADVLKHAVLCRVLVHLRQKLAAFRVIDSHAGAGHYDLTGVEAGKTGEWREGIGRLIAADLPAKPRALLAPYLDAVAARNSGGSLAAYPGSPALAQALLRRQDRLIACELEPQQAAALTRHLRGDTRCKAIAMDGWTALGAYVPPKERRGLVLIDPPFEQPDEFTRLVRGFTAAHRKWATGIYMMWYPIKDSGEVAGFIRKLARLALPKLLRTELVVDDISPAGRLGGCGLIVANPPWTLEAELQVLLPVLAHLLSRNAARRFKLDWLSSEIRV
jgi:23S rRNA (adenine2030-N6)-methyltransferase